MYSVFLRDWFDQFPRDQFLVVSLENYAANTDETLGKIFRFLGMASRVGGASDEKKQEIRNKHYIDIGPIRNDTRSILKEFYAEFNADLAALLQDDSFLWKQ